MFQDTLYQFEVNILLWYVETLSETTCSPIKHYKNPACVIFRITPDVDETAENNKLINRN